MSLLNKHFWKFFAGLLAIVVLGFLVIYGADFYNNPRILRDWLEARKTQKQYEDLKKLYEADTYGGKTPEETLALFIDTLNKVIERFLSLRKSKLNEDEAWFVITDENRVIKYEILLGKNQKGLWKILEL